MESPRLEVEERSALYHQPAGMATLLPPYCQACEPRLLPPDPDRIIHNLLGSSDYVVRWVLAHFFFWARVAQTLVC